MHLLNSILPWHPFVMLNLLITVICIISTSTSNTIRDNCPPIINWAPGYLKHKSFVAVMNNAYCPSWMSRDFFTKRPATRHLKLPRGIPLAVLCGVNYYNPSSTFDGNLTITQTPYYEEERLLPQVAVTNKEGSEIHTVRGLKCRLQYAITGPLTKSGKITCVARYNAQFFEPEPVTYTVYDIEIIKHEETINVGTNIVNLTCPGHPMPETKDNPLVHVWFYPRATSPRIAAQTTNPSVKFPVFTDAPLVVSCATYHLQWAEAAVVTTFTVTRSQSYELQGKAILGSATVPPWDSKNQYGIYGEVPPPAVESNQDYTAGSYQLPLIVVVVLSATLSVLGVLIIVGGIKFIQRRRNQQRALH